MRLIFKSIFEVLHKPEWVAALALLIQAVILGLQWKILRRHAKTMEEHTETAGIQARTAELIAQSLQQQGQILSDQTKIMDEQLKFQRRVEAKVEREKVFETILELQTRFVVLEEQLSTKLPIGTTVADFSARECRERAWSALHGAILPCQRALITSIHLSEDEKNYFIRYSQAIDGLKRTDDVSQDVQQVQALCNEFKDFGKMMMKAAQTPL